MLGQSLGVQIGKPWSLLGTGSAREDWRRWGGRLLEHDVLPFNWGAATGPRWPLQVGSSGHTQVLIACADFIGSRFQEQEREVDSWCSCPTQPMSFPAAASALHLLLYHQERGAAGRGRGGDTGENDPKLQRRESGQDDL